MGDAKKVWTAAEIDKVVEDESQGSEFVEGYHAAFDEDDELRLVESKVVGQWRWGTVNRSVIEVKATGELFAVRYRNHAQEGFQDAEEACRVKRIEKTVVDYVPVEEEAVRG